MAQNFLHTYQAGMKLRVFLRLFVPPVLPQNRVCTRFLHGRMRPLLPHIAAVSLAFLGLSFVDLSPSLAQNQRTPVRIAIGAPVSPVAKLPFRNKRIDLDLHRADLHNVMRLLAREGNTNIIVGKEISGLVTLSLRQVRVKDAFDVILQSQGLCCALSGEIILVQTCSR